MSANCQPEASSPSAPGTKPFNYKKWMLGIIIILGIFLFVPTFIAGPDGLERVMEDNGVEVPDAPWTGLLTDYTIPGIEDPLISGLLAGIIGTAIMACIAYLVIRLVDLKRQNRSTRQETANQPSVVAENP